MKIRDYLKLGLLFTQGVRWVWITHFVVSICHVALSLYFVFLCKQLIDIASGASSEAIFPLAYLPFLVIVGQILCSTVKNWLTSDCEIKLKNRLRVSFFTDLMYSCNLSHQLHTGDVVNRLEDDVRIVAEALGRTIPLLLATGIQFIFAFYYLCLLDSSLAWVVVLIMPVCLLLSKLMVRKMKEQTLQVREEEGKVQTFLQEHIQHLTLLQTLQQENRVGRLLEMAQQVLYAKVARRTRWQVVSRMWVSGAFALGYVIAFTWGVQGISSGLISFGMMTAFLQLASQIQNPLLEISRKLPSLVHAMASVDRLMALRPVRKPEPLLPSPLYSSPVGITFHQVSFTYPDGDQPVFTRFSYDFPPGSCTAILGESGVGKSTLIRLMLALQTPQEGKIEIYGTNFRCPVGRATRTQFVYVPQGNSLLSGTIRENLLLGNPEATTQEMWQVLKVAAAEFVADSPLGLDTPCQELGGGLSEGQAQRIAIARALLRKGNIYLFDEITASLDAETEQKLVNNILSYCRQSTLLFITHRPYILSHCHQVLQIKN